jgi:uncharacterized membrane protein
MIEVFFLLLALGFLVLPFVALISAGNASRLCRELGEEVQRLREQQVLALDREQRLVRRVADLEEAGRAGLPPAPRPALPAPAPARAAAAPAEPAEAKPAPAALSPPPLPVAVPTVRLPQPDTPKSADLQPPPVPVAATQSAPPAPVPTVEPALHMERFMGAKLFAWIGGLALFLGILFFVKLSLERGWISPALRTWTGLAVGAGLVGAGLRLQRNPLQTPLAQTLCATGVVALYGVAFAAHALWRIPPFHLQAVTFAFLSAVTAVAFTIAVRHHAQVVAVLGMLGGFLTPVLCSTGEDRPFALFSYIALLDLGVLAVAQRRRWTHLVPLAATGTLITLIGWLTQFFRASEYGIGAATWLPVGLLLGFPLLFALAAEWLRRRGETGLAAAWAALGLVAGGGLMAFTWLEVTSITTRPWVLYSLVLGLNAIALGLVAWQPQLRRMQTATATLTFLHLLIWTQNSLTADLLLPALAIYLGFGVLHSAFAAWLQRRQPMPLTGWLPLLAVALLLLPVLHLPNPGLALWPALLLADFLVIGLAWLTGALLPVLAALVLTLLAIALWLFGAPSTAELPLGLFLTLAGTSATVFAFAGQRLARRFPEAPTASLLPASSALLPFLLLIVATGELRLANPTPVFALALVLGVFLLALVRAGGAGVLAPAALAGVLALQQVWLQRGFAVDQARLAVIWQLSYLAVFSAFPFVFRRRFATETLPWITAAAASLGSFGLMHQVIVHAWPNEVMGLLPAAFALLPAAGFAYVQRRHSLDNPARLDQLAWFGGTALFFVTLIFPLQFDKQWLTLGWACEGAALCWLFGRVPHPGLRATGAALLVIAFARLAVLPAVSADLVRGALPILNWPLYTYSLAALALFTAAAWLKPPHHLWGEANLRAVFRSLAGVLLFLLLNLEIADAFTAPGQRVFVFDFGGHLARDMTYSLAWALFAFGLLVLGLWRRHAGTRYAGIGLLGATVLKLFLHDLARIDSGWRVGALVGVALVALAVSYLYQRWLSDDA